MPEDDGRWSDFSYLWGAAQERGTEKKMDRTRVIKSILDMLELASRYPEGSQYWLSFVTVAQRLYAFQKRGKGRPKRKRDLDDYALAFMVATSYITGETSTSKLAAAATDAGLVRKTGSHATRVDRLARKYAAYKRKPRSLNLDGGKYDDAKILLSDWLIVKMCAWRYAATKEPHLIMERARDFAEFLRGAAPNIEQEFESDEEWGFMNRPFPTVEK